MFDVGLSEMMVIMVVALVVIGPDRLPKVARTLGHLWGRAQRYISGVKAEISRDMALEELRKVRDQVEQQATSVEQAASSMAQQLDQEVSQLNQAIAEPDVEALARTTKATETLRQRAVMAAQNKLPAE
jgi:sec-independent protein translocase protein TatB